MTRLWIDTVFNATVVIGTQLVRDFMTGVSATDTRLSQMTLLRTIIGLDLSRTVHDSGEGSEAIDLGIGVFSQEVFAAAVLPDPGVSTDFPTRGWVWRQRYRVWGFAADQPAIFTRRIDLDLRSQRKLENGHCAMAVDLIAVEGANSGVNVTGCIRQLWNVS